MRLSRVLITFAALGVGGRSADGQGILLQIKPRVGDTLRMRLDQQTEMMGTKQGAAAAPSTSILTSMQMFSRAIVEGVSASGTLVLAVTDSVLISTTDARARTSVGQVPQLRGQRVRFHVAADGMVSMGGDEKAPREVAEAVSLMPAAFPRNPVSVGESWVREMMLPAGKELATPVSGKLRVTFRLDSVTHSGDLAYVSMHGEMQPAPALGGGAPASTLEKGSVDGTMLVDRRRGWLTESRFNIAVSSTITSAATTGIAAMRMHVKITQHMRTMDRR